MAWMGNRRNLCATFLILGVALAGVESAVWAEGAAILAYDDGTAEAGRAVSEVGSGFAVRFTPKAPGDILLRVSFYVSGLRGDPAPVEVHVWNVEKKDLVPPVLATATGDGWFDVDVSTAGLVLGADVYVGYLQTSAENHPWLGIDTSSTSDRSFVVPSWAHLLPEGACAMIRILTQRAVAVEDGLEVSYDDGAAEAGRGYGILGAGYAVRFTPPTGGARLQSTRIYITGLRGDPAPIEVHIWSIHGEDLIAPVIVTPLEGGWLLVDLSSAALSAATDVWIGYLQTSAENYPWLGVDQGTPTGRSYSLPDWNELLPFGANAMIRAIFARD